MNPTRLELRFIDVEKLQPEKRPIYPRQFRIIGDFIREARNRILSEGKPEEADTLAMILKRGDRLPYFEKIAHHQLQAANPHLLNAAAYFASEQD